MPETSIRSFITTHTGLKIPQLGFGAVFGDAYFGSVEAALKAGIRHFDTAQLYGNEQDLADALATLLPKFGISREEIFICTKYNPPEPVEEPGPSVEEILETIQKSRAIFEPKLGYVDLLLLHQPRPGPIGRARCWEAIQRAKAQDWVKDVGVSNLSIRMLEELPAPVPAVNQIEVQPWYQQKEIREYCQSRGIAIVAFCPLVRNDPRRMGDPVVAKIAERHGKDVGQVLLRWSLQHGVAPIPASSKPSRVQSNTELYDFSLSKEEMKAMDGLELGQEGACSVKAYELIHGP